MGKDRRFLLYKCLLGALALPILVYVGARAYAGFHPDYAAAHAVPPWRLYTLAGDGIQSFGGDGGPARRAQLNAPYGMAFDGAGNLIFSDYYNHRIRRIDRCTGTVTTLAGTGQQGYTGDGGPGSTARLNGPYGVAVVGSRLFIGDYYNHCVRELDLETGVIVTFAGTGKPGFQGDGGPARTARLNEPLDIRLDPSGRILYVADFGNNRVRKIDLETERIATVAGSGAYGYSGDGGPAVAANLDGPFTMVADEAGTVYISDAHNHCIRRVDGSTGIITTLAGIGIPGSLGDGGFARLALLHGPYGLALDGKGHLFFSDSDNDRIRRIHLATGIIVTVAGSGSPGSASEGELATEADLNGPYGIALDPEGSLYVAEYFNHRIRKAATSPPARDPDPDETPAARLSRIARQVFGGLPAAETEATRARSSRSTLGRALFHDRRLSRSQDLACVTCHDLRRGGMDGKIRSRGHAGREGVFNTPTILNAHLQEDQFWDARARSLEEQAEFVLFSPVEMAMPGKERVEKVLRSIPGYRERFAAAFPGDRDPVSFANTVAALADFQRTLHTPGRFDRFVAGELDALDARERRGLELFLQKGCAACHRGPILGSLTLMLKSPMADPKRPLLAPILESLGDEFRFKVPQLRNIAETAPYLHDGSAGDLETAIRSRLEVYQYGFRPSRTRITFAAEQLGDLVAFLASLSGAPAGAEAEPTLPPSGPDTPGPDRS